MSAGLDRSILRLAIPSILAAISTPLIGIADTAMVGHLPQVAYLGAVATASVIFDVLFWSTGFLRMGTTSLVAQYHGAGDRRSCLETLYRSMGLALALGLGMLLARHPIALAGFGLAGGSPEVQEWGQRYFAVRILGAPLVLVTLALNGFFLGTGNALAPMAVTMAANLVNVTADWALIFGHWGAPALGVVGAAWASVLGNTAAALVGVAILLWRYGPHLPRPGWRLLEVGELRLILRTNANLFGRTLCLLGAQFAILGMVSRMGEVPLAANAIVWQVWALVSYGVDGFAHAAEALVGAALGARGFARARQVSRRILGWGVGIGAAFGLLYLVALEPLARAFTEHRSVVEVVASLALVIAPVQPLNAVVFVFDGIFIGANDMGYLFRAMAVASLGVFLPAALLFVWGLDWGVQGAWMAYDGLMVGRFLTLLPRYRGSLWLRTFVAAQAGGEPGSAAGARVEERR
ncbi:MAG: MATE family efflux transporter [Candidatus Latescibacterota bacterium]